MAAGIVASEAMRRMKQIDAEQFCRELVKALGSPPPGVKDPFPRIESASQIAGFPLGLGHASRYCDARGVVLVGDAAHRVHPLAGQGVNLGFGDAECLARLLEEEAGSGSAQFGAYSTLKKYETERQRHNVPMMLGIDFLQRVYCTDNPLIKAVRSLGVNAIQSSPMVKRLVTGFAN